MEKLNDEQMREALATTRNYCFLMLNVSPRFYEMVAEDKDGVERIIWEHGRRNFALRAAGLLSIVCPISDDSNIAGVGIFNASVEEVKKIMDDDPGVKAGIFVYETHPCRSFPGDSLPA